MGNFAQLTTNYISYLVPSISAFAALMVVIGAFRSGVLSRIKFGAFEVQASKRDRLTADLLVRQIENVSKNLPFETEQLAKFYAQVLAQSKTSFWFSLVFASIGFLVIVLLSLLTHLQMWGPPRCKLSQGL